MVSKKPARRPAEPSVPEPLRVLFERERLPMPPVPAALATRFKEVAPSVLATRDLAAAPHDLDWLLNELQGEPVAAYAVAGFVGLGGPGCVAVFYLVLPNLAVFVQKPWSAVPEESEAPRRRVDGALGLVQRLQEDQEKAVERNRFPLWRRLVIVESDFHPCRWGWQDLQGGKPVPPAWHEARAPLLECMSTLREMLV
jgi:hypothetical protein